MIVYINNDTDYNLESLEDYIRKASEKTLEVLDIRDETETSFTFVSKEDIHAMNLRYRGIDRHTDVLSFPAGELYDGIKLLGDVVICYDQAVVQASEYGNSIEREVAFLSVHGLLHLLGYDHLEPEEEKEMVSLQKTIINRLFG